MPGPIVGHLGARYIDGEVYVPIRKLLTWLETAESLLASRVVIRSYSESIRGVLKDTERGLLSAELLTRELRLKEAELKEALDRAGS